MLTIIILVLLIAIFVAYEHTHPSEALMLNRAGDERDFVNQWLPTILTGIFIGFSAYRLGKKFKTGAHFLPESMSHGPFPGSFMAALGALTCHEFMELAISHEGGLTAWAPMLALTFLGGVMARYGQEKAGGGSPSIYPPIATLVFTGKYLVEKLIEDDMKDEAESLIIAENPKLFKRIRVALKAKKEARMAALEASIPSMIPSNQSADIILEELPKIIVMAAALVLVVRFVEGRKVIPLGIHSDTTSWCVMIGGCTVVSNAIYRSALNHPEAHPDDFFAMVSVCLAAGVLSRFGSKLQTMK
mmetsp:Transcript_16059/g.23836  ORF Transcript_16059/g.23836 Transcript_16059/m.23836 type:complete len:302 (+) Transcript_16059:52-957(+)